MEENMKHKFSEEDLKRHRELTKKYTFLRKNWKIVESYTLDEYAYVLPFLAMRNGDPEVVVRKRKDGTPFLKVEIPLEGGDPYEFDLTYEKHHFKAGNIISEESARICVEEFLGTQHLFLTGELL